MKTAIKYFKTQEEAAQAICAYADAPQRNKYQDAFSIAVLKVVEFRKGFAVQRGDAPRSVRSVPQGSDGGSEGDDYQRAAQAAGFIGGCMKTLRHYKALGFDETIRVSKGLYRPRCSACSALVVNNVAIHERGCLNERRECRGCSTLVGRFQTYCKDCS